MSSLGIPEEDEEAASSSSSRPSKKRETKEDDFPDGETSLEVKKKKFFYSASPISINDLPNEILVRIFNCVKPYRLLKTFKLVSHRWNNLITEELSRPINFKRNPLLAFYPRDLIQPEEASRGYITYHRNTRMNIVTWLDRYLRNQSQVQTLVFMTVQIAPTIHVNWERYPNIKLIQFVGCTLDVRLLKGIRVDLVFRNCVIGLPVRMTLQDYVIPTESMIFDNCTFERVLLPRNVRFEPTDALVFQKDMLPNLKYLYVKIPKFTTPLVRPTLMSLINCTVYLWLFQTYETATMLSHPQREFDFIAFNSNRNLGNIYSGRAPGHFQPRGTVLRVYSENNNMYLPIQPNLLTQLFINQTSSLPQFSFIPFRRSQGIVWNYPMITQIYSTDERVVRDPSVLFGEREQELIATGEFSLQQKADGRMWTLKTPQTNLTQPDVDLVQRILLDVELFIEKNPTLFV